MCGGRGEGGTNRWILGVGGWGVVKLNDVEREEFGNSKFACKKHIYLTTYCRLNRENVG